MPTHYQGRIFVCVGSVLLALFVIFGFPPSRLFDPNLTLIQRTNLNPGIDMVGGVRLIYQIKVPEDNHDENVAEGVMDALKRRVDPNGLRNLVWRPQGKTRLEIQMPLTPESGEAPQIRRDFNTAKETLDATNILPDDVMNAVEKLTGADRDARLKQLAADSKTRADLFKQLAGDFDQIQQLRAQKISPILYAEKAGPLTDDYSQTESKIDGTNLSSIELTSILDETNSDDDAKKAEGQAKWDELQQKFADFPSRLTAMEDFKTKYQAYDKVKLAITGAADLKQLLQGSGVLEFHILADRYTVSPADLQSMEGRLTSGGRGPIPQPGDAMQWMEVDQVSEFDHPGYPPQTHEYNGKHYVLVLTSTDASMTKSSTKWGLKNARLTADPRTGGRAIEFEFDAAGGKQFGDLTEYWYDYVNRTFPGNNAKARLAIVLDNKVISAPSLDEPITTGTGVISSGAAGFTEKEADYLINTLNAGSLPAQLSSEPISEEQVGPTLGADNLRRGLIACAFGMVVVGVFLVGYYYIAGLVAFIAVLMNVVLILGVMAGLGATFTLPCIAGIVLTVGTAVDANVLIFERLREEQHKGLNLRMALRNSYIQARSAIIDSNMTSVITSACLYLFGSEEVKGFGLTLIIGIGASLFTALYVTKTIFGILIDKFGVRNLNSLPLTFPKWDKALRPNWDWMGKAWIFYTFSIVFIAVGFTLFIVRCKEGRMLDIEFTSGTSVQFELNKPMNLEDVRKLVDEASAKDSTALPSPSVVTVGSDQLHYEVVTPNTDRDVVKQAILGTMTPYLHIQLPSTYSQVTDNVAAATGNSILPIANSTFTVDGFHPPTAMEHVGGVAMVLRNITPPLSAQEIRDRLNHVRESSSSADISGIEFNVDAPGDPTMPTLFAVIVGWNTSVAYSADRDKWREQLVTPLWNLTHEAINSQASFEKETNLDAQVAGETRGAALGAMFCSLFFIMIYIWTRFGNLKFGTATVIALLHDTIFTLAAIGFAHYIADYWHDNFLQIEQFRINLTVVAGILTIMSYSMIDTIVVFDRIRENRGKYGHMDRAVINTAINQTLSRTLLTAGTSIMTVSFMYFMGGAGIHGFTFVLLVGILVGTYSSVAIAAPLLLWGKNAGDQPAKRQSLGQLQQAAG